MDKLQKDNYSALKKKLMEKYDREGINALSEHELLTLIISYSEPVFADIFADKLLSAFGSVNGVCLASPEKLISAGGISQSTAALLKLIPVLSGTIEKNSSTISCLGSPYLAKMYFAKLLAESDREKFAVCAVTEKFTAAGQPRIIAEGSIGEVSCSVADIALYALDSRAKAIFIAHCHPHGDSAPSDNDVHFTSEIICALEKLGISVIDHIITGKNSAFSMRTQGFGDIFPKITGYGD